MILPSKKLTNHHFDESWKRSCYKAIVTLLRFFSFCRIRWLKWLQRKQSKLRKSTFLSITDFFPAKCDSLSLGNNILRVHLLLLLWMFYSLMLQCSVFIARTVRQTGFELPPAFPRVNNAVLCCVKQFSVCEIVIWKGRSVWGPLTEVL